MAACKKESIVTNPCTTEALGVWWCLQLARTQGFLILEIQTDAMDMFSILLIGGEGYDNCRGGYYLTSCLPLYPA
jgi:hypothetical protein